MNLKAYLWHTITV